jgi:hypothetical protein
MKQNNLKGGITAHNDFTTYDVSADTIKAPVLGVLRAESRLVSSGKS